MARPRPMIYARVFAWCLGASALFAADSTPTGRVAPKPLYRDPVFDGAADPSIVYDRAEKKWLMFYTNRRANVPGLTAVTWVHGTPIGIAESTDGAEWKYRGTVEFPKDIPGTAVETPTYWAPCLVEHAGVYHMFVTIVPGVFTDWNHPRNIVHLTSPDLEKWKYESTLPLVTDKVIDPCVLRLPDGTWRLWYNNERAGKSAFYADSPDLFTWADQGSAHLPKDRGEAPLAFVWKGRTWLLIDLLGNIGLGAYRSDDALNWERQPASILDKPGTGPDDQNGGHHPEVVVSGDRAFLFYFVHPGVPDLKRSSIQVAELKLTADGWLSCDRDAPTRVALIAPPEFANPIVRQRADPHLSLHADGFYYFAATVPEYDRLELRRAKTIAALATAAPKTIWRQHATGAMGSHIWAPELHRIDGHWFIYFAAGGAEKVWDIRIYVLENAAANPLGGEWMERGQLKTNWESFALDATTFEHRGARYLLWAQKDPNIKGNTNLYLAKMDTPTSIAGAQVMISKSDLPWEQVRYWVNEGPAFLRHGDKVFISYSAAGTGAEYCLGLLTADANADLLDPKAWTKSPSPVFVTSEANGVFGPGHNSFTTTPDGKADLLVYHARSYRDILGDPLHDPNRHTRVQPLHWKPDGTPDFGEPLPDATAK